MDVKKGLVISVLILTIVGLGSGIAWSLGNTLTPQQFADVDMDKHVFNPTPLGNQIVGSGTGALFRASVEIDSFVRNSDTEYEETNKTIFGQVGVKDYANCRDSGSSVAACDQSIKDAAISTIARNVIDEKDSLKREQDEARKLALYADELQAGDITITQAEINAAIVTQTG